MAEVADATGGRTLAIATDVTDRPAGDATVARVLRELGSIDLLVNNAA
jgi:NAD(P)-dependent dehydrogenase (short-subunit alcohol dehydrogenase family)